jgi:hypothetical protein
MLVSSTNEVLPWLPSWAGPGTMWKVVGGVLLLAVVGRALLHRPPKLRVLTESGRVTGYIGRMGSGKTYAAVRSAYDHLAAGADVYTNFTMHLEHRTGEDHCPHDCELPVLANAGRWQLVRTMDDVGKLRGEFETVRGRKVCVRRFVVILDEVQDLLSADHGGLSDTARFTIKNLRKFGGDLLWTSQSDGGVHRRLKDLTNQYGVCSSARSRKGRTFKVAYFDPENLRKAGKQLYTIKYSIEPRIAGLYDTSEIVVPEEEYVDDRLSVVLDATGVGVKKRGDVRGTSTAHRSSGQATKRATPRPASGPVVVGGMSEGWARRGVTIPTAPEPLP